MDYSDSKAEHVQDQPITWITPVTACWKKAEIYVLSKAATGKPVTGAALMFILTKYCMSLLKGHIL